jgi:hypothetical protein
MSIMDGMTKRTRLVDGKPTSLCDLVRVSHADSTSPPLGCRAGLLRRWPGRQLAIMWGQERGAGDELPRWWVRECASVRVGVVCARASVHPCVRRLRLRTCAPACLRAYTCAGSQR